jgi:branched-chain amino acid transport system substrate-binding protein
MKWKSRCAGQVWIVVSLFAFCATVCAQSTPGVTTNSILIGSCSALDGPARFLGSQTVLGATAYLHGINDQGGVHGRRINLTAFDDGYDPEKAPDCFKRMEKEGVFALGFFVGTPTAAKYVPLAQEQHIPVVGLFTGAQILYEPVKHYVINVRASYYDETHEQVSKLWDSLRIRKIGVIYQDDAFGKAVLDGVKRALEKYHATPAALGAFARNTTNVSDGLKTVMNGKPEAVILAGPYAPVAEIVKQAHAAGWHPLFLTVSFVGTEEFIRVTGSDAEGTVITQVLPPYDRMDFPTVAQYRAALEKYYPGSAPSFVSFEGYVDAMVLVEGLKRAGSDLSRDKLITAIESIHHLEVGLGPKLTLNYSATDHQGFDEVYATVVKGGKAVVLNDWTSLSK